MFDKVTVESCEVHVHVMAHDCKSKSSSDEDAINCQDLADEITAALLEALDATSLVRVEPAV